MPYYTRKNYRRGYRGRAKGYNRYRGRTTNQMQNKQIYALKKRVNALSKRTQPEKYYEDYTGGTTAGTTAAVIPFTLTRDAQQIYLLKLYGSIYVDNNASALATTVRVVFVLDRQQVADTTPSYGDIFETTSVMSQLSATLNPGRFKILKDIKFQVSNGNNNRIMKTFALRLGMKQYYNGATSTDIQKNGVYMFIWSDKSTNLPTYGYNLRLQYYDN